MNAGILPGSFTKFNRIGGATEKICTRGRSHAKNILHHSGPAPIRALNDVSDVRKTAGEVKRDLKKNLAPRADAPLETPGFLRGFSV